MIFKQHISEHYNKSGVTPHGQKHVDIGIKSKLVPSAAINLLVLFEGFPQDVGIFFQSDISATLRSGTDVGR